MYMSNQEPSLFETILGSGIWILIAYIGLYAVLLLIYFIRIIFGFE
jgi:hypothetical protein